MYRHYLVIILFLGFTLNPHLFGSEKYKIITHTTQNMEEAQKAMENVMERLNQDPEFKKLQKRCTFDINCRPSGKYCIVTIEPIGNTTVLHKVFAIIKKIYSDAFMNKYVVPQELTTTEKLPQSQSSVEKPAHEQTVTADEDIAQTAIAINEDTEPKNADLPIVSEEALPSLIASPVIDQIEKHNPAETLQYQKYFFIATALFAFFAFFVFWLRRGNSTIVHTNIDNNLLYINQNNTTALLVDVQAHIIPGLNHDDGPSSIDEALSLIMALKNIGYKKVITTPRLSNHIIEQDTKVILHTLDKLRSALKEKKVDIVIEAAACYKLDDLFLYALEQKKLSSFNKNYIIVEASHQMSYESLKEYIIKIGNAGYKTVLSHPEQYAFMHCDLSLYQELRHLKVLLALDINSLSDTKPDDEIKHCVNMLIEHKMIDLIGSNARTSQDVYAIQTIQSSKRYKNLLKSNTILNNYLY